MNNENEVMEKAPVLTKKDCVKGAIRWSLMAVTTFNYEPLTTIPSLLQPLFSVLDLCCVRSIKMMTNTLKH